MPGQGTGLITSCGTDSFVQLKSPVRHSPKAIVFDVPSVMSRIEIGGVWLRPSYRHDATRIEVVPETDRGDVCHSIASAIEAPTEAK